MKGYKTFLRRADGMYDLALCEVEAPDHAVKESSNGNTYSYGSNTISFSGDKMVTHEMMITKFVDASPRVNTEALLSISVKSNGNHTLTVPRFNDPYDFSELYSKPNRRRYQFFDKLITEPSHTVGIYFFKQLENAVEWRNIFLRPEVSSFLESQRKNF